MTAKEYLTQARDLDGQIAAKREQAARLHAMITGRSQQYSDMPRGGKGVDWTDTAAMIIEMEAAIKADVDRLIELKAEIKGVIDAVPDTKYRMLLECRYLAGWSWNRIAREMHYSYSWARQMHGQALKKIVVP